MKKILVIISLLLLSACKNQDAKNQIINDEEIDNFSESKEVLIFLSDNEVENSINHNECIFLSSYWAGMTKQDAVEVTRYLLDKHLLYGKFFQPYSEEPKYIEKESLNIDTFDRTSWRYSLRTNNYFMDADIQFSFNNSDELDFVSLWINDIDKYKYNELLDLFKTKYGTPVRNEQNRNQLGPFKYAKGNAEYTFEKGYQQIRVEYRPKGSGPEGMESKFNDIYIMYEDLRVIDKNTQDYKERMKTEKIIEENNKKKGVKNSLEKI